MHTKQRQWAEWKWASVFGANERRLKVDKSQNKGNKVINFQTRLFLSKKSGLQRAQSWNVLKSQNSHSHHHSATITAQLPHRNGAEEKLITITTYLCNCLMTSLTMANADVFFTTFSLPFARISFITNVHKVRRIIKLRSLAMAHAKLCSSTHSNSPIDSNFDEVHLNSIHFFFFFCCWSSIFFT